MYTKINTTMNTNMNTNMNTKSELIDMLKEQLTIDYNCTPQDFSSTKNVITTSKNLPGRRHYIEGTFFLQMASLGQNVVITADECMHPWLSEYMKDKTGYYLFEHLHLCAIDNELRQHGKQLWQSHHMFLPNMNITEVSELACVKWFEQKDIGQFYEEQLFENALCSHFQPERPDVLAVTAYDGDKIIGMAGCSADTPKMWQIGIDIHKDYRGKGLGTYLVTLLKNEVIRRDKVPFYGTSLSNLYSQNIALKSGFYPAWIEIETIEDKLQPTER